MRNRMIDNLRISGTPDGWAIAFVYDVHGDKKLHFGDNHPALIGSLYGDPDLIFDLMPGETPIFGWIYKDNGKFEVEFASDIYGKRYNIDVQRVNEAKDLILERYPITSLVYDQGDGPIKLSDSMRDPRLGVLERISRQIDESVI